MMLSILCLKNSLMAADLPNARREGVHFLGLQLSTRLNDKKSDGTTFVESAICVLNALQTSNGANREPPIVGAEYGLWIEDSFGTFVAIKEISHNGNPNSNKIACKLSTLDAQGNRQKLTLTIHEDNDKNKDDRKMEIVIPDDRSRVTDPNTNFYVLDVVEDIEDRFHNSTSKTPELDAAYYTLASITFRRCA